jgi:hypothetical protein
MMKQRTSLIRFLLQTIRLSTKEQKKKVEKEAIKNQFLEKTETKVKKAIKDLIYMTVDQEQYEVEVEVSE